MPVRLFVAIISAASAAGARRVHRRHVAVLRMTEPRFHNENDARRPNHEGVLRQLCSDLNASLAGVENGQECYCGNKFNTLSVPTKSTGCTVACNGKQDERWVLGPEVFDVNCSGAPVLQPVAHRADQPLPDPKSGQGQAMVTTLYQSKYEDDMISRMTIADKINAMQTNTQPIPSLSLPAYNWWSEASSGVSTDALKTTKFAFPITTGMSFNRLCGADRSSDRHGGPRPDERWGSIFDVLGTCHQFSTGTTLGAQY